MIGKCTCHMAHNCLKIDNFEKNCFGGIENYMYCKKYLFEHFNEMPCGGNHLPYHVTSPIIYFKHLSFKCVDFSEMYISSNYKYRLTISMNIPKDFTQESPGKAVLVCKDPYLVLHNNIYKEWKLQLKMR